MNLQLKLSVEEWSLLITALVDAEALNRTIRGNDKTLMTGKNLSDDIAGLRKKVVRLLPEQMP
jgi:hypothetical protein